MSKETDLNKSGVYVRLFNGQRDPSESLDDWGDDGHVLGPFKFAHVAWASEIKLGDDGESLKIVDSTVLYAGTYYADFSVVSAAHFDGTTELRAMYEPFDQRKSLPNWTRGGGDE
ncbi:MAG: hypothetical protein ACJ74Q_15110 [Pyrinomonadaceae bacterium]